MKGSLFNISRLLVCIAVIFCSCGPSVNTTASWVNREKIPEQPIKSIFIIAFTENLESKMTLEGDLAKAAGKKGIKAYKSIDVFGPVSIKQIAPNKDVFMKKLQDLNCETIFTVALVDEKSETRYVSGTTAMYSPYGYGAYGGYGGFGAYGMYGGFGGYYGYSTSMMSTPGYYTTDKTYFIDSKLFDLKTEELLLSIQSKAENPSGIKKASAQYTQTLMDEVNALQLRRKHSK